MSKDEQVSLIRRLLLLQGGGAIATTALLGAPCGAMAGTGRRATIIVKSCGHAGAGANCVVRTFDIDPRPIDGKATRATKDMYAWLISKFGKFVISGQTDQNKFDYVKELTGSYPLLRGFDMQRYSPRYSWLWDGQAINPSTGQPGYFTFGPEAAEPSVSDAISWYHRNGRKPLISYQWHWHSPSGGVPGTNTFYTDSTTFDTARAVVPGTREHIDTLRDIDAIAVQLKRLRDADVPVIWRPLHESGGTWFWWSAKGPAVYKSLWDMVYERLVHHHGLHNLLWCWSGDNAAWYPGDDKVDLVGIDSYPGNPGDRVYTSNKVEFDKAYTASNGRKLIAMTENGPIPDIETSLSGGAPWSFFTSWNDVTVANDDNHLKTVYSDPRVITLERYS